MRPSTPGSSAPDPAPLGPLRVDVAYNDYPRQPGPLFVASPPVGKVGGQLQLWPRPYPPPGTTVGGSFFKQLQFQFSVGEAF